LQEKGGDSQKEERQRFLRSMNFSMAKYREGKVKFKKEEIDDKTS